jgi:hypothetical protein
MSRRTCLISLAASFALAAPATSLAQSSSQAQYQGVAPETRIPVAGGGNGNGTPNGPSGTTSSGAATTNGATKSSGSSGTSGASGNGGPLNGVPVAGGAKSTPHIPAPSASSDTMPFTSSDIVLLVLAVVAMAGLGILLRRSTRAPAGA